MPDRPATRILVTGGAGFIGSHLVDTLVARGAEVLVVDDLSAGSRDNVPDSATLEELDILDPSLAALLAGFEPEAVVHLAAQTSVSASVADPEQDRRVNVDGTHAVARASATAGAGKLLMASTAAVYGEHGDIPLQETARTEPVNPYGVSKLAAEDVLADVATAAGAQAVSMRLSNVYGPRQSALGEGGVVAVFCARAVAGRDLVVHGDGSQTRDFLYVGDAVTALLAALDSPRPLSIGGPALNVSTGVETSIVEVADVIAGALDTPVGRRTGPARPGDVPRSALDPTAASTALGWRATTSLPDGIAETLTWFREASDG